MIRRRVPIKRSVLPIRARSRTKKKQPKDLNFRAWIRAWPCFVCFKDHCEKFKLPFWRLCHLPEAREMFRERSLEICGETQAAHVGSKGMSQMCPDREMMPLGERHHLHPTMGGFPDSHHAGTKTFWKKHGLTRLRSLEFLRHLYVTETGKEI